MNKIKLKGRIKFDPKDVTTKHHSQANWKRVAMVMFTGDVTEYYSWFIERRYNLVLNRPLRGGHITFINDRKSEINDEWDNVKKKWDGKEVEVTINLDPRTNSGDDGSKHHWWLKVPEEDRDELLGIRNELGLGKPNFGFHMTIGYANDKNKGHSMYLHKLIKMGIIK